jgi:hypothetical protein
MPKKPKSKSKAVPKKKKSNRKPAPKRAVKAKPKKKAKARARAKASVSKWVTLVDKHGVVMASAQHPPVLNIAEAVAGEPIVGSWWAHPKGKAIFAALSELDDSDDVRCFKLIDHKVTFVHRRLWPALVRLARDGVFADDQVTSIQQEHMPTGEHHNILTPLADWIDDATSRAADALSPADAREQLGTWLS